MKFFELENLSQGARIAFARQFRGLTQDEVSDKLGLTGESKRRTMARYERGDRTPKEDRLLEIANILNISEKTVRNHISNAMQKLEVKGRASAVVELLRLGEISL